MMNMLEMMYNQRFIDLDNLKEDYKQKGQIITELLEKHNLLDITEQELREICGTV